MLSTRPFQHMKKLKKPLIVTINCISEDNFITKADAALWCDKNLLLQS